MSDIGDTDLVFDGVNGLTGDVFVRNIRRRVLAERIHQDDQLIAHTAASCFQGPALDWYEDQTDETQESWKLLRRAVLTRWPSSTATSTPASGSSTSNVPTPAAAPPNPTAVPATNAPQPPIGRIVLNDGLKNGKIRVVSMDGQLKGYMSTTMTTHGHLEVTSAVPNIAIIRLSPNNQFYEMQITNDEADVIRVGVTWAWAKSPQQLIDGEATWAALVKVTGSDRSKWTQSSTFYSGLWGSHIWSICADGRLLPSWEVKPRLHRELDITYGTALSVTNNFEESKKSYNATYATGLLMVKLFFEPV